MEYIQQLIEKFWKGEASEQERKDLYSYLLYHREELAAFLKKSGDSRAGELLNLSDEASAEESLKEIHRKAGIPVPAPRFRMRRHGLAVRFAAAAVLVIAFGTALFFHLRPVRNNRTHENVSRTPTASIMRTNTGKTDMLLTLPDQTLVHLAPHSTIVYTLHFGVKQRNISLKGEARFRVTENAAKPFTVYADGYATTALGTEFIVRSHVGKTSVKLLSGKVVVRATASSRFPMKERYLIPGDELYINTLDGHLDLLPGKPDDGHQVGHESARISGGRKNATKGRLFLHFDDTPLATVFAQIENALNMDIICVDTDLTNLSFTGRLSLVSDQADSLDAVLSLLCQENGLVYSYKNNQIIISGKQ